MTARTLDFRQALAARDAHSYYAITELAKREGLTPLQWSAKYAAGLPFMLEMAYASLVILFERRMREWLEVEATVMRRRR